MMMKIKKKPLYGYLASAFLIMRWLRAIFWESVKFNFELQAVYILTDHNIICDSLSRLGMYTNIAMIRDADSAAKLCCYNICIC